MAYTVKKSFPYGGERLQVGDTFEPKRARDLKIMKALGKIEDSSETLEALRAEAESLGIEVDGRWGDARLREKIEEHRSGSANSGRGGTYKRRDMRAED